MGSSFKKGWWQKKKLVARFILREFRCNRSAVWVRHWGFLNLLPCDSSVQTRQRTIALKLIALITGKSLGLLYATGVLK